MDRWKGRVALLTGASSGIGAAIAVKLVQDGMTVIGCARRAEKIQASANKSANAKKPRTVPSHPRTSEMVNDAIKNLKEPGGSSPHAIKKYISRNYKVDTGKLSPYIKRYLRSGVQSGSLVQTTGKGATGSFKLGTLPSRKKPKRGEALKAKRSAPKEKPGKETVKGSRKKWGKRRSGAKPKKPPWKGKDSWKTKAPGQGRRRQQRPPESDVDENAEVLEEQPDVLSNSGAGVKAEPVMDDASSDMLSTTDISYEEELGLKLEPTSGKLYAVKCDVTKEAEILELFDWIKKKLGGVDVLVNNAGIARNGCLTDVETPDMRQMLDVNVLALSIFTREAIKSMRERNVDDGHVIHINSAAGHKVIREGVFHFYSATKYAVTALTEGLRMELASMKSRIRVTSISPGLVETEILDQMFNHDELFKAAPHMDPKDIAEAVRYALSAPPHVQVHNMLIYPTGSP